VSRTLLSEPTQVTMQPASSAASAAYATRRFFRSCRAGGERGGNARSCQGAGRAGTLKGWSERWSVDATSCPSRDVRDSALCSFTLVGTRRRLTPLAPTLGGHSA